MQFNYDEQGNGFVAELTYTEQKKPIPARSSKKTTKAGLKRNNKVTDKVTDEVTDKVTDKVTDHLSENQVGIIRLITENAYITTIALAKKLKISQRKIKENISKLKDKGILVRVGPAKGGHWETAR